MGWLAVKAGDPLAEDLSATPSADPSTQLQTPKDFLEPPFCKTPLDDFFRVDLTFSLDSINFLLNFLETNKFQLLYYDNNNNQIYSHHIHSILRRSHTLSKDEVSQVFLSLFHGLLGPCANGFTFSLEEIAIYVDHSVSSDCWHNLSRDVTFEEVRLTLFSIVDDKALGLDGFIVKFYQQAGELVGPDFITKVCNFFQSGQLLGEVNATVISLIPKVPHPKTPSHF